MIKPNHIHHTKLWIQKIVIGLNLCPFAKHPFQNDQIRYVLSEAKTETELFEDIVK